MAINDETLRLGRQLRIRVGAEVDQVVRELVQAWARAWDEVHGAWNDAAMDLAKYASLDDGQWPDAWTIARHERAQAALLATYDEVLQLAEFTGVTVSDAVGRVVTDTPEWHARIIASQFPATADREALVARFNRVDRFALSAIVERTTQQVTSTMWLLPYQAQEQMRRVLIRGVALGDNPRRAAAEMVARAEGTFNGGLTRALTIARTEMLDAHRSAGAASHFANADVLTGWVWLAQLDTRTCPSCLAMHGTEHNLDEVGPMDHQQGRCARMPKTKTWRDLGIDLDEPADITPDAKAWFDGLSRADQTKVMGPDRLAALDAGVPWHDLAQRRTTPGWRDSWAPTPARDLLARVS